MGNFHPITRNQEKPRVLGTPVGNLVIGKPESLIFKSQIKNQKSKISLVGPPARHDSLLGIEMHAVLPQDVQIAKERVPPSSKREEGHGRGNADVDADHTSGHVLGKLTRSGSGARKH